MSDVVGSPERVIVRALMRAWTEKGLASEDAHATEVLAALRDAGFFVGKLEPVTTRAEVDADGNWTDKVQPNWCGNCEEYSWDVPVYRIVESTE